MSDGPKFKASKQKIELELKEGASRVGDYEFEVEWVANNIGNLSASPAEAPSNAAWNMLVHAMRNAAQESAFYNNHYKPIQQKKSQENEGVLQRKQEIRTFDLLNQFKKWKNCPHCGEEITAASFEQNLSSGAESDGIDRGRIDAAGEVGVVGSDQRGAGEDVDG